MKRINKLVCTLAVCALAAMGTLSAQEVNSAVEQTEEKTFSLPDKTLKYSTDDGTADDLFSNTKGLGFWVAIPTFGLQYHQWVNDVFGYGITFGMFGLDGTETIYTLSADYEFTLFKHYFNYRQQAMRFFGYATTAFDYTYEAGSTRTERVWDEESGTYKKDSEGNAIYQENVTPATHNFVPVIGLGIGSEFILNQRIAIPCHMGFKFAVDMEYSDSLKTTTHPWFGFGLGIRFKY